MGNRAFFSVIGRHQGPARSHAPVKAHCTGLLGLVVEKRQASAPPPKVFGLPEHFTLVMRIKAVGCDKTASCAPSIIHCPFFADFINAAGAAQLAVLRNCSRDDWPLAMAPETPRIPMRAERASPSVISAWQAKPIRGEVLPIGERSPARREREEDSGPQRGASIAPPGRYGGAGRKAPWPSPRAEDENGPAHRRAGLQRPVLSAEWLA